MTVKTTKKLIEVALPLEAINAASAREKSIRHGHPSTLHLWWARRPLAAARAVIFAQMVDDPSEYVDVLLDVKETRKAAERELKQRKALWEKRKAEFDAATGREDVAIPEPGPAPTLAECAADIERQRLFRIIEELVKWENTTNEHVLEKARAEIWQSWRRTCAANADHPRAKELFNRDKLPAFHDPFAGGGALPLEAQRLGLESYASDLNPVAVLINKAMIEIPPKFAGLPPVNPDRDMHKHWKGAQGLADDVRYYGQWMRDEAEKRVGHLYPKVEITAEMAAERPDLVPLVGQKLTVIAWIWARTVKSPNPAFKDVDVPLASTFVLSKMKGNEAWIQPIVEGGNYSFKVRTGPPIVGSDPKVGTKLARGANFRCIMSGTPIEPDYIKREGREGRLSARIMALVADGPRGRIYLDPSKADEEVAGRASPSWRPETSLAPDPRALWTPAYGLRTYGDLFTNRQLVSLTQFSDLIAEVRAKVQRDLQSTTADSAQRLGYAESIAVYLALAVSSLSDRLSTICTWDAGGATWGTKTRNTFARQAIPMSWDFAEVNPFSTQSGSIANSIEYTSKGISLAYAANGTVKQLDASSQSLSADKVVSTDPPYYDNIGYADLSDYFYVWMRRALAAVIPDLFSTIAVPKAEELVASPYRHDGKALAEAFFLAGMTNAMKRLADQAHAASPVTIYYAFKQSETETSEGTASTGWETFLDAVIQAGFAISGTWPMRTELSNRMIGSGTNALASSIVLVCRKRDITAPNATRREFLNALASELPVALALLQEGNIAPVDLAQAAIGPGMAVYTRYSKVLDAEGKAVSVREALALINETLDEALAEQEGDFDADSRWALAWFEQNGFAEGEFGTAEILSKAKNTAIAGLVEAGIVESKRGKVRLLKPEELPETWDPATDTRLTSWEIVHHLVRVLNSGGESAAAQLAAKLGAKAEVARELAYRLYSISERKKRAGDALAYNALVQSWPEITRLAREVPAEEAAPSQADMFGGN
jgi:putative DNA methylase